MLRLSKPTARSARYVVGPLSTFFCFFFWPALAHFSLYSPASADAFCGPWPHTLKLNPDSLNLSTPSLEPTIEARPVHLLPVPSPAHAAETHLCGTATVALLHIPITRKDADRGIDPRYSTNTNPSVFFTSLFCAYQIRLPRTQ